MVYLLKSCVLLWNNAIDNRIPITEVFDKFIDGSPFDLRIELHPVKDELVLKRKFKVRDLSKLAD